ncbi:Fructosamine kinase-domain-containing protein [Hypoxylon trugodes]|uniref:Fructosamine kinase-domain-containing protein n=1 Tax=Hypoxylon trugodes TaxID=326681 RepID=UPI00219FD3C8|nr:Fructosamine kinase-domain-containing protein [Hypoxylon trugodes]KAI1391832.1 Fructosamine kinase-domain-containing protein [Hypoxylon trugodes]
MTTDTIDLDRAILRALPPGCQILSVSRHGKTHWSTGLKVAVKINDKKQEYFVKVVEEERFVGMSEAEYEGQKALATYIPDNVITPIAWVFLEDDVSKSFFVTRFRHLEACSLSIPQFLSVIEKLHRSSVSPTGKFGFHVTTYYGPPPMINDWTDNWEEYFIRQFWANLEYAQRERGEDPELQSLAEDFIEKVIPRLLRPLQTGGRSIKPALCHGDLWDGNIQIDVETKQPIMFDSCCFYGHNEMDLQCMGDPRYALGMDFIDLYKNEVGPSEPQQDFYDRHDLYAIRNNICVAGMWPQWAPLLTTAKDEMRRLLSKHPMGLDGFEGDLST